MKRFIHQEILDRDLDTFQPAFALFGKISAVKCLEAEAWPVYLLVTADFARTVHASENQHLDSFLLEFRGNDCLNSRRGSPIHYEIAGIACRLYIIHTSRLQYVTPHAPTPTILAGHNNDF